MIAFVLRLLGYCLSGRVDHDFIVFCYGAGGNGKSTMLDLLRTLLGDYYVHLPMEALLAQARGQRDSQASAELVRLLGARFAVSSEIPEGRRLNESLVKDLSGGGVFTARELYAQPVTFTLTHKLWLMGNHKPEIHGQDAGIWRRIHMVPFEHQFPKSGEPGFRDRTEVLKELREESSGILNVLLAGLHDLERNGLNPPAAVKAATDTYRVDSDPLGDFIDEQCVTDPSVSCPTRALWDAYSAFSRGDRGAYSSQRKLTTALEGRGYKLRRTSVSRLVGGITLIDDVI